MTDTLIAPRVADPDLDDGEPIFTHIVGPLNGVAGAERVMQARILGIPVEALCGYMWVPTRDPENYPVCERCSEILAATK